MNEEQLSSMIIPFYLDEITNTSGEKITEIWQWDFRRLESSHSYIQWLFPLQEKSSYNPYSPTLTEDIIQTFLNDEKVRSHLFHSFSIILKFYGLDWEKTPSGIKITKSVNFAERKSDWLGVSNHNYLRLTRILKSLSLLGYKEYAEALYECLAEIYNENQNIIGEKTWDYWQKAIERI